MSTTAARGDTLHRLHDPFSTRYEVLDRSAHYIAYESETFLGSATSSTSPLALPARLLYVLASALAFPFTVSL
jgi:hypothetical protein